MSQRDYVFMCGKTLNVALADGRSFIWPTTHPAYAEVLSRIFANDITGDELGHLMDVRSRVSTAAKGYDDVEVTHDGVKYKGELLRTDLTRRIVALTAEGYDVGPMVKFLVNVLDNPRHSAREELYDFLEKSNMPLTEDGHFIAYKIVSATYKDLHTGTFDNSVGSIVQMEMDQVDVDRNRTCSTGLHVCSKAYLPHFGNTTTGSDRIVIVKINPAHVVAVPADYDNAKMRVWKYEVIGELNAKDKAGIFEERGLFRTGDYTNGETVSWFDDDDDDDDDYPFNVYSRVRPGNKR